MQILNRLLSCRQLLPILILSTISFALCCKPATAEQPDDIDPLQSIRPTTISGLKAFYQALDYDWQELDEGVPPFILESIPADINKAITTKEKKRSFFMGLLPMVLLANQEIAEERNEVQMILERNNARKTVEGDRQRLETIAKRYGLRGRPLIDHRARARLLQRVDTIPPALVLAQAANESAWGTSRFARLGNNIFGEWTFNPGSGIVPEGRPEGATYEVRKFKSIYQSIRSYMNNLNRHGAYTKLREIRRKLRKENKEVTGTALAKGLLKYSQRGEEYVREIQAMIRQNRLERINQASLRIDKEPTTASIRTSGAGLLSSRNRIIGHRAPVRQNP